MASRFLTRSKTLALALSRADAAAPLAGGRSIRALSSIPRDPAASAAPPPSPPVAASSPLGLGKILGYEQTSGLSGAQVLCRWFSTGVPKGSMTQQAEHSQILEKVRKAADAVEQPDSLKAKDGSSPEVITAYSQMEASLGKPRSSPLTSESSKIKRSEIATKVTYYMIPALLLASKNSISTSLLVLCVFHQIYMFYKEIFLDYIHHDITRLWVLIYFKLFLLLLAKDTIVYFNLV